jgi:hypothetical protein
MKVEFLRGAAMIAAIILATPASATIIDAIYKGTVKDGIDGIGLYGPAGADLTGDAFVATFNMDTSKGTNLSTPTENFIEGGAVYGTESPMIKATLEINGKSAAIDGSYNGVVQAFLGQPGIANQQTHSISDAAGNSLLLNVINANFASVGNIPFTIDVPLDFVLTSAETGGIFGTFHSGALATALDFSPTELIYQYPSPNGVPEPSTWAMMLLGFAGLACAGFRRRPQTRLA